MSEIEPCIYCSSTGRRTDEHVLQEAFGGPRVVLKEDVCGACNNRFSSIDGVFVDFVRTLSLAAAHPDQLHPRTLVDGTICFSLDPVQGVQQALRVEGKGPVETRTARVFPQLVLVEGMGPVFRADGRDGDPEALLRLMVRELHDPGVKVSSLSAIPEMSPPAPPMIVRSGRGKYVIIAASHDEERIRKTIASKTFDVRELSKPQSSTYANPDISGRKVVDNGAILRAIAKVSVNFVCHVFGRDVALRPALAPLRRYAFGAPVAGDRGTMSLVSAVPLFFEEGLPLQAQDVPLLEDIAASHCDEGHHLLLLLAQPDGNHLFLLALYGRPVATVVVELPDLESAALAIDYRQHTSTRRRRPLDDVWFNERLRLWGAVRQTRAQIAAGIVVPSAILGGET